jgi:uncharacterized protein YhjY with autotransporter beta-barrel domain
MTRLSDTRHRNPFFAGTLRASLLATCAGLALGAPAFAQNDEDPAEEGPVVRGTLPEGGTIVFTTWEEGSRLWREYYWVVPEGGGDAHGYCLMQSYTTFFSGSTEPFEDARNQPLSFCNRDMYGNYEPGRAPWDRENRGYAEAVHGGNRSNIPSPVTDRDSNCIVEYSCDTSGFVPPFATEFEIEGMARPHAGSAGLTRTPGSSPLVVAGDDSTVDGIVDSNNQFSNVVFITIESTSGTSVCTGSLINRRQVLAAAHCFVSFTGDVENVSVSFSPDGQGLSFGAMGVTVHEDYNPFNFEADVAVVTLATTSLAADPVTLEGASGENTQLGSTIVLAGYGNTGTGTLGEIGIDGNRRYGVNTLDGITTWDTLFNATGWSIFGGPNGSDEQFLFVDFDGPGSMNILGGTNIPGEVSSGRGDSGGPLFVETANGLIQIGIVSNGGHPTAHNGLYGTVVAYVPVANYIDWIEGLDPFIERHAVAGDGLWHDAAHWDLGDIPENDRAIAGSTVVTDQYLVPELYEVFLDAPGTTTVQQNEYVDAVYVFEGAELVIDEGGQLALDTGVGLTGGDILVNGELIGQAMELQSGSLTIGETGSYFDFSPYYNGGINLSGADVTVDGIMATDWLHQTGGTLRIGETGIYFDYTGSLIEGGELHIDGIFDTTTFAQIGGITAIFETGLLYDATGQTYVMDSDFLVAGEVDTLELIFGNSDFGGAGTIYAPFGVYQIGGTVRPGIGPDLSGSGDALTIEGDYYLSGGNILFAAGPAGVNHLQVNGTSSLDGNVDVYFTDGYQPARNSQLTFLVSEGGFADTNLSGPGDDISPILSFSLGYTATTAYLELEARSYSQFAETDQQRAVASALDAQADGSVPTGDFGELLTTLDYLPTEDALRAGLQTANPSDTFAIDRMGYGLSRSMGDTIATRMAIFAEGRHGGGMQTAGLDQGGIQLASSDPGSVEVLSALQAATRAAESGQLDGVNDRTGFYFSAESGWGDTDLPNGEMDIESNHVVAGVDFEPAPNWLIGANAGFSDYSANRTGAHVQGESVSIAAYAGYAGGSLYGSGYIGGSWLDYDLTRTITLGSSFARALGNTEATQLNAGFDMGMDLLDTDAVFGPVLRLRHGNTDIDGYTETGAGVFNASLAGRETDQTLVGIGGRYATDGNLAGGDARIFGQLTWEQDISDGDGVTSASLAGAPNAGFTVLDGNHDDGFASLALGIDLQASERVALSARLRSDIGRDTDEDNSVSLAISWQF